MDSLKLNELKNRLLEERDRINHDLDVNNEFGIAYTLGNETEELSSYDNHPADLGSETFERQKDLALLLNYEENRQRINEALQQIDEGKYGICEDCGQEIPMERLEALPYTTLCINCQREEEDHHQNRFRPIEEEFLWPPFGRTFLNNGSNVGTDGEDVWQDVAKYGTSNTPSDLGSKDYGDTFYNATENAGIVDPVDAVIDVGPDRIPPDPGNDDQKA